MTTKELRLKAAELIEERGLCQGAFVDPSGALCMVGAIRLAGGVDPRFYDDTHVVEDAIIEMSDVVYDSDDEGMSITQWSDSHSQAEVIAKLREGLEA